MSEFTSEKSFFVTAVDPNAKWSSIQNVLTEAGDSQTWARSELQVFTPNIPMPGGVPILPTITFNNIRIEINWRRGGREGTGSTIVLQNIRLGGGNVQADSPFRAEEDDQFAVDAWDGDLTYWGLTQQQVRDLFEGTGHLTFEPDGVTNGSEAVYVKWVKIQVEYTYTGQGAFPPRLF